MFNLTSWMNLKTSSDGAPNVIKESDSSDSTWNQVVAANASPNPSTPNAFSYGYSHSGLPSFSPLAITTPPLSTIMFDPATHSISAVSVTDLSNILISTTSHKASVPNQLCLLSLDSVLRASDVNTNQTPVATEIKHMFPTESGIICVGDSLSSLSLCSEDSLQLTNLGWSSKDENTMFSCADCNDSSLFAWGQKNVFNIQNLHDTTKTSKITLADDLTSISLSPSSLAESTVTTSSSLQILDFRQQQTVSTFETKHAPNCHAALSEFKYVVCGNSPEVEFLDVRRAASLGTFVCPSIHSVTSIVCAKESQTICLSGANGFAIMDVSCTPFVSCVTHHSHAALCSVALAEGTDGLFNDHFLVSSGCLVECFSGSSSFK